MNLYNVINLIGFNEEFGKLNIFTCLTKTCLFVFYLKSNLPTDF